MDAPIGTEERPPETPGDAPEPEQRDVVTEQSDDSFPASDPPSWTPARV